MQFNNTHGLNYQKLYPFTVIAVKLLLERNIAYNYRNKRTNYC